MCRTRALLVLDCRLEKGTDRAERRAWARMGADKSDTSTPPHSSPSDASGEQGSTWAGPKPSSLDRVDCGRAGWWSARQGGQNKRKKQVCKVLVLVSIGVGSERAMQDPVSTGNRVLGSTMSRAATQ